MVHQLTVGYYTRGQQLKVTWKILLAILHYWDVKTVCVIYVTHVMVGTRSSTRQPGLIRRGKYETLFTLPRNFPTCVELWY